MRGGRGAKGQPASRGQCSESWSQPHPPPPTTPARNLPRTPRRTCPRPPAPPPRPALAPPRPRTPRVRGAATRDSSGGRRIPDEAQAHERLACFVPVREMRRLHERRASRAPLVGGIWIPRLREMFSSMTPLVWGIPRSLQVSFAFLHASLASPAPRVRGTLPRQEMPSPVWGKETGVGRICELPLSIGCRCSSRSPSVSPAEHSRPAVSQFLT